MLSLRNFSREDVGLYVCGASNEMNRDGDRVEGVVYLNMDPGNDSDDLISRSGNLIRISETQ